MSRIRSGVATALIVAACVLASGCRLDDASDQASAIEAVQGVASVDLEGGYQFAEWVHVRLVADLDVAGVHRVAGEISTILDVRGSRWGAADLEVTRPDGDGEDVYVGLAGDLGAEGERATSGLEGWLSLAVCPQIDAVFRKPYSHGHPTILTGSTESVAECLGALPDSGTVQAGLLDRAVALMHEGLTMRWDPALTPDIWRAASMAWNLRDPVVRAVEIDLHTYPSGVVGVRGDISFDGRTVEGWTPAVNGHHMGAVIDPLIQPFVALPTVQTWTLHADDGGFLAFGSVVMPGEHVDITPKPGIAAWNEWLDRRLLALGSQG